MGESPVLVGMPLFPHWCKHLEPLGCIHGAVVIVTVASGESCLCPSRTQSW